MYLRVIIIITHAHNQHQHISISMAMFTSVDVLGGPWDHMGSCGIILEVRGIMWDPVGSCWRSVGSCGIMFDDMGHMPRSNLKQLEAFILIISHLLSSRSDRSISEHWRYLEIIGAYRSVYDCAGEGEWSSIAAAAFSRVPRLRPTLQRSLLEF